VGTNDHTHALVKMHKNQIKNKSIDYFELSYNDFLRSKYNIKYLNFIKSFKKNYDVVILSSFEYRDQIKKTMQLYFQNKKIVSLYGNSSRSIMDTYLITRKKVKINIYKKGVHQKL